MARRLLISLLVSGALLALPCAASAASPDVCVWDANVAPAPTSCGVIYAMTTGGLVNAVQNADFGFVGYEGETTLRIGPGDLHLGSTVTIAPSAGEQLNIVGAGSGAGGTVLVQDSTAPVALNFWPTNVTDSSISNLAINVSNATDPYLGMNARGGRLNNVSFRVPGDTESYHSGLLVEGLTPTVVSDSKFTIVGPGNETLGVKVRNNSTITRSNFLVEAVVHPGQVGVRIEETPGDGVPGAKITRSSFVGFDVAISQLDGLLNLQDVVIDLLSENGASGISVRDQISGSSPLDFRGEGLTIVGAGDNQQGVGIDTTAGDDNATANLSDMIGLMTGPGSREVSCDDHAGSSAALTLVFSHFALANYLPGSTAGGCAITQHSNIDRVLAPAKFVNAAIGDYRPTADSPVVDAGNDDADRNPPKLDLAGNPRFVDGNNDGTAIIDIGAFEYQQPVVPVAKPAPPADVLTLSFGKVVGKVKITKKPKTFSFTTAKKKPRLPVTSNLATPVELTLARSKAGYVSGDRCVKTKPRNGKKKRCDIPLKGRLALQLPAGTSYLTFSGKFAGRTLKPGKYSLYLTAAGLKDSPKSILNVIR